MVNFFLFRNNDYIIYKINFTLETHFFIPFPTWSYFQTLLYRYMFRATPRSSMALPTKTNWSASMWLPGRWPPRRCPRKFTRWVFRHSTEILLHLPWWNVCWFLSIWKGIKFVFHWFCWFSEYLKNYESLYFIDVPNSPDNQEGVEAEDLHQERIEGRPGQDPEGRDWHCDIRRGRDTHRGDWNGSMYNNWGNCRWCATCQQSVRRGAFPMSTLPPGKLNHISSDKFGTLLNSTFNMKWHDTSPRYKTRM